MADEIDRQNEISVWKSDSDKLWHARIGPNDGRGVEDVGLTPWFAVMHLQLKAEREGWIFDPSWRPQ